MDDHQDSNAIFDRLIDDNVVIDRKRVDVLPKVRPSCCHVRLCRVELALLLNRVEESQRDIETLGLFGNESTDFEKVVSGSGGSEDMRHYFLVPSAFSSSAS